MAQKITVDTEVSATEVAAVLGISARRVQQLAQDGTFPMVSRGKYLLCDVVKRYIAVAAKRLSPEGSPREAAETELKQAKATKARLEAEELEGKMHRAEDIAAMTEDLLYAVRGALLALPGRLAVDVAAAGTAAEASEMIKAEAHRILDELAEYRYDPQKYAERVRERQNWDTYSGGDDE